MPTQIVASHHDALVLSKGFGARYFLPLFLGSLLLFGWLISIVGPLVDPHSHVDSPEMRGMMGILSVAALGVCYCNAGPCELRLDPHARRYRYISGLPLFVRTLEGPYEEIASLVIRPYYAQNYRNSTSYKLEIDWAVAGRKTAFVQWLNMKLAYEVRDDIQKKAGLPVVWET